MEAVVGMMQLQVKRYRGLLGATRRQEEARKCSSLEASQSVWPYKCLDFRLLVYRMWGSTFLLF